MRRVALLALLVAIACLPAGASAAGRHVHGAEIGTALVDVLDAGIPGAAALVTDARGTRFYSAGVGDRASGARIRRGDAYRIASMAKAFNGAVVLSLVRDGRLSLDDTLERWLPGLLPYGGQVTVRELLRHRGGVPNYTATEGFADVFATDPQRILRPLDLIGFVEGLPLTFPPGTGYAYSNTDNILLGMIVERVTGEPYAQALQERVFDPLRLRSAFLAEDVAIPGRHVHGYAIDERGRAQDVTTALSPSGAWASGAIVASAPQVGRFFRALLAGDLYGAELLRTAKRAALPGASSPPGPGRNRAGLALFRYRLPCGVVWGHTGLFPGYRNYAVASPDGRRSAVVLVNGTGAVEEGAANRAVRRLQRAAACAALGG